MKGFYEYCLKSAAIVETMPMAPIAPEALTLGIDVGLSALR